MTLAAGGATVHRRKYPDALSNGFTRSSLLAERMGFGKGAHGGLYGPEYVVTTNADSGAGSLRAGLEAAGPRWITFHPSLDGAVIRLLTATAGKPDKTVDGRGVTVTYENWGIRVAGNTILSHLTCDFRGAWDDDFPPLVGPREGPGMAEIWPQFDQRAIWFHHLSFVAPGGLGWFDEAVNFPRRAGKVTVSWCHFDHLDHCFLSGNSTSDANEAGDLVTAHHNWFDHCQQRQPLLRYGRAHFLNNLYDEWGGPGTGVAMQVSRAAQMYSERNVFDDIHSRPAILNEEFDGAPVGKSDSVGDLLSGTTWFDESLPAQVFAPSSFYTYTAETADAALRAAIKAGAGNR